MVVQKLLIKADKSGPLYLLAESGLYSQNGSDALWVLPAERNSTLLGPAAFSTDGKVLILCDSLKSLYLLSVGADGVHLLDERRSEKCSTAICFESNDSILVADRFGDVTRYAIKDGKFAPDPKVILGHVSIITDMLFAKGDNGADLIVTADRDEKIRLTRAAEPHLIEAFLLAHTEYVAAVKKPSRDSILSVSGDGALKLWDNNTLKASLSLGNHVSGRQVQVEKIVPGTGEDAEEEEVEVFDQVIVEPLDMDVSVDGKQVAIIFDQSNEVALVKLPELEFDRLVKLSEGHQAISLAYTPSGLCLASFEASSGLSHLHTISTDPSAEIVSKKLEALPTGSLDLEKSIWKGGMRKDCHGLFAKRLLKRKLAAAKGHDEPSDIDEE